ncbi:MAG TPA: chemotaxis protein CheC [Clostridiales bacterium]|nr:chemotaxis protein CheC [Clostridiales bacterium]
MNFHIDNLNSFHLDVLKEIANIGAGNAATALSIMVNRPIGMNVPKLKIIYFNEVEDILGGADIPVTGIYLEFNGDIKGTIMFVLDEHSTLNFLTLIFGREDLEINKDLDDMEISALKEVGNILTGSFLTSLSQMTGLTINYSIPAIAMDMAGAILSVPLIEFGQQGDRALFIETNFLGDEKQVRGHLFLIPSIESYTTILQALGVA